MTANILNPSLELAVKAAGSPAELIRLVEGRFTLAQLYNWRRRGDRVPAEFCPDIEQATNGEVLCEHLRPDVKWAYLRGTAACLAERA